MDIFEGTDSQIRNVVVPYGADPQLVRAYHSSVVYDGRIYIFGGRRNSSSTGTTALTALNDVWVLSRRKPRTAIESSPTLGSGKVGGLPALGTSSSTQRQVEMSPWTCRMLHPKGSKPARRSGHCAVRIGTNMYVIGGLMLGNQRVEAKQHFPGTRRRRLSLAALDFETFSWNSMRVAHNDASHDLQNRHGHTATPCFHPCGSFMGVTIFGGAHPSQNVASIPLILHSFTERGAVCDRLICTLQYDDEQNAPSARSGHAACAFGGSNVLIFGGKSTGYPSSVEMYYNDVFVLQVECNGRAVWRAVKIEGPSPTPRECASLSLIWESCNAEGRRRRAAFLMHGGWGNPQNRARRGRVPWSGDSHLCYVDCDADEIIISWKEVDSGLGSNPWLRYGHTSTLLCDMITAESKYSVKGGRPSSQTRRLRGRHKVVIIDDHVDNSLIAPKEIFPEESNKGTLLMPLYRVEAGVPLRLCFRIYDSSGSPVTHHVDDKITLIIKMDREEAEDTKMILGSINRGRFEMNTTLTQSGNYMVKPLFQNRILDGCPFCIQVYSRAPNLSSSSFALVSNNEKYAISAKEALSVIEGYHFIAGSPCAAQSWLCDKFGNNANNHEKALQMRLRLLPFIVESADSFHDDVACALSTAVDAWFPKWCARGFPCNMTERDAAGTTTRQLFCAEYNGSGLTDGTYNVEVYLSASYENIVMKTTSNSQTMWRYESVPDFLGIDDVSGVSDAPFQESQVSFHIPTTSGWRGVVIYDSSKLSKLGFPLSDEVSCASHVSIFRVSPDRPNPSSCVCSGKENTHDPYICGGFVKYKITICDKYGNACSDPDVIDEAKKE